MAQTKNLIDSFMSGLMQEAKAAVDSVTTETPTKEKEPEKKDNLKGQGRDSIGAGSGQGRDGDRTGTPSGQDSDTTVTPQGHHRDTTVTPLKPKKGQGRDTIQKGQGRDTIQKEIKLADKQLQIYKWFLQNGLKSTFNKPLIMAQTGIAFTTIRKALRKFENIGLLRFTYDDCTKLFEYEINTKINVKNLDLGQGRDSIGSGSGQGRDTALISSSSLFKKTTTMQNCESDAEKIISEIMNTDPEYTYWIEHQVTSKQATAWKKEFGLDLQTILNNLCYVRWQIIHQKAEIKKGPVQLVYGIMKKNGGTVNKPAGYKSMAQLDMDYYESWKKQRQERQKQIEQIKADAVEAEIKPQVEAILQNLSFENEDLQTAIDKIATVQRKQVIKTSVKNAIKNGKPLGEKENSTLKFYLEMVLKEKAFKKLTLENNPGVGNADFLGSNESGADFLKDTHRT